MALHTYRLTAEFIELNQLLKFLGLASSGGGAKALIVGGGVDVDGVKELRIRRKLRAGQKVQIDGHEIEILPPGETDEMDNM